MTRKAFEGWLRERLIELNTDENVFGEYIIGILDGDESTVEKTEALESILGEINSDISGLVSNILDKWSECQPKIEELEPKRQIDVNEHLAKLLESQRLQPVNKEKKYTEEELRIKQQILAQYSQTPISDEECDDDVEGETASEVKAVSTGGGIEKNTNVQDVLQLQKERREQARMDSAAKKQKDKEDREKQRQLREEKKEKRKTVKGERRR